MDNTSRITATEFARRAGVNRETVRRHILAGKLPAERLGRIRGHAFYLLDPALVSQFKPGRPGRPVGSKASKRFTRRRRRD